MNIIEALNTIVNDENKWARPEGWKCFALCATTNKIDGTEIYTVPHSGKRNRPSLTIDYINADWEIVEPDAVNKEREEEFR